MSLAQVQEILNGAEPAKVNPGRNVLYFTYGGHLCFEEFKIKHPDAKVLGAGYLENWTWHINALGAPVTPPR